MPADASQSMRLNSQLTTSRRHSRKSFSLPYLSS
jgi:hypothetical protein